MPRYVVIAAALYCALLHTTPPAHAAVECQCFAALQAKSGWSVDRRRTVRFMTGMELSRMTRVLNVEFRHLYAVISHGGGLPTVVRLDAPLLGVGREFTEGDFARLFELNHERLATQIDGEARDLKWRLRASML